MKGVGRLFGRNREENLLAAGLARELPEQPDEIFHNPLISACFVTLRRGRPSFDARRRAIIPSLAVELFPDPALLSCVVPIWDAPHEPSIGIGIIALLDAIPGDQFSRLHFFNQMSVSESRAVRQVHPIPRTPRHVASEDNSHGRSAFFAVGRGLFAQVGVFEDDEGCRWGSSRDRRQNQSDRLCSRRISRTRPQACSTTRVARRDY